MTHSKQARLDNIDLALRIIFNDLGDRAVYEVGFEIFDEEFKDVFQTTWQELEDTGLIELHPGTMGGNRPFTVTGEAWAFWVEKCGRLDEYRGAAITICKARKSGLKDEAMMAL